ncbi:GDP-mannose 4,6-dehydratase [Candidatus Magnetaquicoccaceae bacterium FCR-1]|uniref:GDP-mannose 4,6-dehydratase n=1 Tax=Candidatus Magnetaquiglobus chichijimensis TaxID=3141448 RepID=A0ABQ0CBR1_9PROT
MQAKRALICGISGQDGAYLAKFLVEKGYVVIGTSRDAAASSFANLQKLGIRHAVETVSMSTSDSGSVLSTIRNAAPDEIYYLAGQSSVGLSFEQPVETMESIAMVLVRLLEAIRFLDCPIRFYNAGTSECFGDTGNQRANETTPFRPRSPYAVAKASAHQLIGTYREAYGLYACTGILFNHESPLRLERFVTQKIVRGAAQIARGGSEKLQLGNLDIYRDWGWAPEYVEAMWLMLQQDRADDFVIATGETVSLRHFLDRAFRYFDLDWNEHVISTPGLQRPSDIRIGSADPSKAKAVLGWSAKTHVDGVVDKMCEAVSS